MDKKRTKAKCDNQIKQLRIYEKKVKKAIGVLTLMMKEGIYKKRGQQKRKKEKQDNLDDNEKEQLKKCKKKRIKKFCSITLKKRSFKKREQQKRKGKVR